jgi:acetoacetyl-CoA reductase
MWQQAFGAKKAKDVPIGHVTNGIHTATWVDPKAIAFWKDACGFDALAATPRNRGWKRAVNADPVAFWALRSSLRAQVVRFTRDRAVRAVEAELGPVDVLVNNAGITRDGAFHKMSPTQWSDVIRVNMDSVFNMTRQVIGGMREREWGRIVNISSINGQKGQAGQTNYAAAKAGMIGFTKALALENARKGVTVNCICPGYIDTEMVQAVPEAVLASIIAQIPVGRLGRGEEIADMVAFLTGEHAGFVTGSTLSLNGGQYMAG